MLNTLWKWFLSLKLHWQILLGLALGLVYGIIGAVFGWGNFTTAWIAPFGTIFINLLKFIAVPLVFASLVTGVASLSDLKKLSRIGGKTIGIYVVTTAIAVTFGLVLVNIIQPGTRVPDEAARKLQATYAQEIKTRSESAAVVREQSPLKPLVDMVPSNAFKAASNNRNMLQVVFIAFLFGVGLIRVPREKGQPVLDFFNGLNEVVLRLVDIIMYMAPIGVFALIAQTINQVAGKNLNSVWELLAALGVYMLTVILGLIVHMLVTYTALLKSYSKMSLRKFFRGVAPAQLLAFSTSSSGATLPITMECAEKNLGVSEEVSAFALPLGATINMDGTALYQAVATVFIAQALGMQLGIGAQLTIVFTAVLASIGTAAVPGAGIIMLVIILEAVGVPSAGLALILGVDRILDMLRTTINVTGDLAVSVTVAASEGKLSV